MTTQAPTIAAPWDILDDAVWRDTGCALGGPSCLHCCLPRCVEDVPGGPQAVRLALRDEDARRMYAAGCTSREVATAFGLSLAQVKRVLAGRRTAA